MAKPVVATCHHRKAFFDQLITSAPSREGLYFSLLPTEVLLLAQRYVRVEDGVYALHFADGKGLRINLSGGQQAWLGEQLSRGIGTGNELKSLKNDNTHLHFTIKGLRFPKSALDEQSALVVNGSIFHLGRPESLSNENIGDTWTNVYTLADSALIQQQYKITPLLRKHPGHSAQVTWTSKKTSYTAGEKRLILTMHLKNVGQEPFTFQLGGSNRGARDNQFHFTARHLESGTEVPDTGNSMHFGGISVRQRVAPNAEFTKDVDLCSWFKFTQKGTYEIDGGFRITLFGNDDNSWDGIWDDLPHGTIKLQFS